MEEVSRGVREGRRGVESETWAHDGIVAGAADDFARLEISASLTARRELIDRGRQFTVRVRRHMKNVRDDEVVARSLTDDSKIVDERDRDRPFGMDLIRDHLIAPVLRAKLETSERPTIATERACPSNRRARFASIARGPNERARSPLLAVRRDCSSFG